LFGYRKGAFTDAKRDKPGRFDLARGGTLFLDEIGDISPALQVKLLRVLQEKMYDPLGAVEPVKADCRIIAATNRNLAARVEEGAFRRDLFYRINIVPISLPPLRERRGDIPLLVEHFVHRYNALYEKNITGVADGAMGVLMAHLFPGNVRELENIIEHAFVMCSGRRIEKRHLPEHLRGHHGGPSVAQAQNVEEFEAATIRDALRRNRYNRLKTAAELGMHKTTLWRKMKKLGLEE
jgi:transcriptional regulator with PAS, ATPase and Fis domain